jgi:ribosomal RNA-processing protein 1
MSELYADQVKLARALVHPDKAVRDATYADLTKFVESIKTFSEMEMLKLWKALYYCLWLSDKVDVQQEVVNYLCGLFLKFKTEGLALLCVRICYRTIMREWQHLDQYRIDKVYRLIRGMIRQSFNHLNANHWPEQLTEAFTNALDEEILQKTPNGLRFQCADVFLEELHNATNGDIQTAQFLLCAKPFIKGATATKTDPVYRDRVTASVFQKFVEKYARESQASNDGASESNKVFPHVSAKFLQGTIFELASDETDGGCRKRLYGLHSLFPRITGEAFVDLTNLKEPSSAKKSAGKRKQAVEAPIADTVKEPSKKMKTADAPAVVADLPAAESVKPTKKGTKKSVEEASPEVNAATPKQRKVAKAAEADVVVPDEADAKKPKKKQVPTEAEEPTRKSVRFDSSVKFTPAKPERPVIKATPKKQKK